MNKIKSNKSIAKRIRINSNKRAFAAHTCRRHNNVKRGHKAIRSTRKKTEINPAVLKKLKQVIVHSSK